MLNFFLLFPELEDAKKELKLYESKLETMKQRLDELTKTLEEEKQASFNENHHRFLHFCIITRNIDSFHFIDEHIPPFFVLLQECLFRKKVEKLVFHTFFSIYPNYPISVNIFYYSVFFYSMETFSNYF